MKKEYINYRIIADKELLEFLRSDEEERFSKMDALCDLLDKASGESRDSLTYFGTTVTLRKGQFVTTVSNLARQWKWHRATTRSFLDALENFGDGEDRRTQEVFPDNNELHVAGNGRLTAPYDVTGGRTHQQVDMWLPVPGGNG